VHNVGKTFFLLYNVGRVVLIIRLYFMAEKIKEQAKDIDDLRNILQRDIEGKIEEGIPEDILNEEDAGRELGVENLKSFGEQGAKNINPSENRTSNSVGAGDSRSSSKSFRDINKELGIADELESEKNRDRKKTGADSSIKAVEPLPLDASRGKTEKDNRSEGEEKSSGNKKVETGKEGEASSNLKKEKKDSERKAKVGGKSNEKNRDRKKTGADSSIKAVEPLPLDASRGKTEKDNRSEGEEKSSGNKKVETGKEGEVSSNLKKEKKDSERRSKVGGKSKGSGSKSAGAKVALDNFLKQAWLNVVTTFTLSMFWVYIHVFLGMIFPKLFCKLGQEWVPKEIKMTAPEQADKVARRIGTAEKGFTGCCCFIHFFLIIIGFVIILLTPPVSVFIAAYLSWDFISSFFD
jgi:hypothetical protein